MIVTGFLFAIGFVLGLLALWLAAVSVLFVGVHLFDWIRRFWARQWTILEITVLLLIVGGVGVLFNLSEYPPRASHRVVAFDPTKPFEIVPDAALAASDPWAEFKPAPLTSAAGSLVPAPYSTSPRR